jgi:hypothetical protein
MAELERELSYLSGMLVDRERELRIARGEIAELRAQEEQSVTAVEAVGRQLEELQAQARGQATRIRMKALKEAAEIGERLTEFAKRAGLDPAVLLEFRRQSRELEDALDGGDDGAHAYQGPVDIEIGPLADFSQLARFEDALKAIDGVSETSVKRFSQGRATLAVRLDRSVELARELERNSPFPVQLREASADRLVLDAAGGYAAAA